MGGCCCRQCLRPYNALNETPRASRGGATTDRVSADRSGEYRYQSNGSESGADSGRSSPSVKSRSASSRAEQKASASGSSSRIERGPEPAVLIPEEDDSPSSDEDDYESPLTVVSNAQVNGALAPTESTVTTDSRSVRLHAFSVLNRKYANFRRPFGKKTVTAHGAFLESLRKTGFVVEEHNDLASDEILGAYEDFTIRLSEILEGESSADPPEPAILIFSFAGHATFEADGSDIHFIAADAADCEGISLSVSTLTENMYALGDRLHVLVLVDGKRTRKVSAATFDGMNEMLRDVSNVAVAFPNDRFGQSMNTRFLRTLTEGFSGDSVDFTGLFGTIMSGADGRGTVYSTWSNNYVITK